MTQPMVYICSPFAGDTEKNIQLAKNYCRHAVNLGYMPIASHLHYPQFLNDADPKERELGLTFGIRLLKYCDEVWVFGEKRSEGMKKEIEEAYKDRITVRYFAGGDVNE